MKRQPINLACLQNLRIETGILIADCPACAQEGKAGRLRVWETGAFQCLNNPSNWTHRDLIRVMIGENVIQLTREQPVDSKIIYPFQTISIDESFWVPGPISGLGQSRRYWERKLARKFILRSEWREGVAGTLVTRMA